MRRQSVLKKYFTANHARALFKYESNGWLLWRVAYGSRGAYSIAGFMHNGRRVIKINGHTITAKDIVWMIHNTTLPPSGVKHLNGDKTDDRIQNIGPVKPSEWVLKPSFM